MKKVCSGVIQGLDCDECYQGCLAVERAVLFRSYGRSGISLLGAEEVGGEFFEGGGVVGVEEDSLVGGLNDLRGEGGDSFSEAARGFEGEDGVE